ncbi:hypothetical protein [Dictyobacter formicarum]|uniref:Uncharacterized protein n=1 Tax=Dictyobacter formicarum TaxID=2778368 RepID=A0ABQ3VMR6_9CHLR|nr:hypothetical protein [Dictyobacter formicarum]GHO87355.1 hypothetical protein KSZ_53610 [Dictyobacter formicarum]GHO89429.1 hypothetical protein KSZ_74350 [Dictyobacter formicarum]
MFQQRHWSSRSLEVLTMYEPHRFHQQFLQAAYALVVPMPCRHLTTVPQQVSVPRNRDRSLVRTQKGARDD